MTPNEQKNDTPLMREARELIAFYDERGWKWESALGFTMCRNIFGERLAIYNPRTHFVMPKRTANGKSR